MCSVSHHPPYSFRNSGAHSNDRGQVVFGASLIENDEHGEQRGVLPRRHAEVAEARRLGHARRGADWPRRRALS